LFFDAHLGEIRNGVLAFVLGVESTDGGGVHHLHLSFGLFFQFFNDGDVGLYFYVFEGEGVVEGVIVDDVLFVEGGAEVDYLYDNSVCDHQPFGGEEL